MTLIISIIWFLSDQTNEDEENPYPGIPTGCCRFLVATVDAIRKFKGTESFIGKVNHVINYEVPGDIQDYRFRVNLLNNSEKVSSSISS